MIFTNAGLNFRPTSTFQLGLRFACVKCGKINEQWVDVRPEEEFAIQDIPSDTGGYWNRWNGLWICNDHETEVVVTIDGEVWSPHFDPRMGLPPEVKENA